MASSPSSSTSHVSEFEDCLAAVLAQLELRGFQFNLKEQQKEALEGLFLGKDVIEILPTGFGKSLIFQLLVLLKSEQIRREVRVEGKKATLLVISPLRSIIEDQLVEVKDFGIEASCLPEAKLEEIRKGTFHVVYSSPECALEPSFLDCLKEGEFHGNMAAVVIDESHTLETWTGKRKSDKKVKVFRKDFGVLAKLRSFCKEGTPFLALTGTADDNTLKVIRTDLAMKDALCIFVSPERKNIRLTVKQVKEKDMFAELTWLVNMLKDKGKLCPKTIIFCNNLNDIVYVFNNLMLQLGSHAYYPVGSQQPDSRLIGIYHANTFKEQKDRLYKQFKEDGNKRVLVASSALSMGVNFPDIRFVINWGPARNLLDQLQEAGRAGRDGKPSHVIVVYHGKQLSHCTKSIKKFVRLDGCYRIAAYSEFDSSVKPIDVQHECCNYCSKECGCDEGGCPVSFPFDKLCTSDALSTHIDFQSELERPVNEQDKNCLRDALYEVLSGFSSGRASVFDSTASHGFSYQLIDDIVSHICNIFSVQDILSRFPIFSTAHAHKVLEVVNEIFMDIPEEYLEQVPCPEGTELYCDILSFAETLDSYLQDYSRLNSETEENDNNYKLYSLLSLYN